MKNINKINITFNGPRCPIYRNHYITVKLVEFFTKGRGYQAASELLRIGTNEYRTFFRDEHGGLSIFVSSVVHDGDSTIYLYSEDHSKESLEKSTDNVLRKDNIPNTNRPDREDLAHKEEAVLLFLAKLWEPKTVTSAQSRDKMIEGPTVRIEKEHDKRFGTREIRVIDYSKIKETRAKALKASEETANVLDYRTFNGKGTSNGSGESKTSNTSEGTCGTTGKSQIVEQSKTKESVNPRKVS